MRGISVLFGAHRKRRVPALLLSAMMLAVLTVGPVGAIEGMIGKKVTETFGPSFCGVEYMDSKEEYEKARQCVRNMLSEVRNPYQRAVLLRLAAQLEVELGNFRQAIKDIEASGETGVLTDAEIAENYFFLGRLYLGVEPPNYDKAIENLQQFIKATDSPGPDAYLYLGQALAMTGRYREAIPHAQKAIELSEKPRENHFRLLLFCYSELKNYTKVAALAEEMLTLFGVKDEYLSQLAGAYEELGRSRDAFLVHAFRYELELLDSEAELLGMADLYSAYGNPHRAARILEKALKAGRIKRTRKTLEKLGNFWFLAREYEEARKWLNEAAAFGREEEPEGLFAKCADAEDWGCIERELRDALKKSDADMSWPTRCRLHILLGHTLNNKGDRAGAIEQFKLAAQRSRPCFREASMWVDYLRQQAEIEQYNRQNAALIRQVKALYTLTEDVAVAVSPDEDAHEAARAALEAAKQARDAAAAALRRRRLSVWERMNRLARGHLDHGALKRARADRKEAERLLAKIPRKKLKPEQLRRLKLLDSLTTRRISLLEQAEADLNKAEEIAAKAREKGE